jgi:hypothetical protein
MQEVTKSETEYWDTQRAKTLKAKFRVPKTAVAARNDAHKTYSVVSGYLKSTRAVLSADFKLEQPITRNCSTILEPEFFRPWARGVWSCRDSFSCRISSNGSTFSKLAVQMHQKKHRGSEKTEPQQGTNLRIRRLSWPFLDDQGHIETGYQGE